MSIDDEQPRLRIETRRTIVGQTAFIRRDESSVGRRPMVDHLREQYRASERHACRVLLMVRGTYRYQSHQEPWTELRMRIRKIAQSRVRYGYRKIRVLLNREGWNAGKYLVYRVCKEEGLALKKRPQRKRKAERHREEKFVATAPNQAWSIDFVADQLQDGTRFRAFQTGAVRRRIRSPETRSESFAVGVTDELDLPETLRRGQGLLVEGNGKAAEDVGAAWDSVATKMAMVCWPGLRPST
jgi:transposase InsO family protein